MRVAGRPPPAAIVIVPLLCGVRGWMAEIRIIGVTYVSQPWCSERLQLRKSLCLWHPRFISQNHVFSKWSSYMLINVRTLDGAEALIL